MQWQSFRRARQFDEVHMKGFPVAVVIVEMFLLRGVNDITTSKRRCVESGLEEMRQKQQKLMKRRKDLDCQLEVWQGSLHQIIGKHTIENPRAPSVERVLQKAHYAGLDLVKLLERAKKTISQVDTAGSQALESSNNINV